MIEPSDLGFRLQNSYRLDHLWDGAYFARSLSVVIPRPLDPILVALADGRLFRRAFSILLRVAAGAAVLATLVAAFGVLGIAFGDFGVPGARLAAVMVAAVMLAIGYGAVNVLLYRADHIAALPSTPWTVALVMNSLTRMAGELYAVLITGIGVGGVLASLFGAPGLMSDTGVSQFPGVPLNMATGAWGAAVIGFVCILLAFIVLVVTYALGEIVDAFFDIAINTRRLATAGATGRELLPEATKIEPTQLIGPEPSQPRCPQCMVPLSEDALAFCTACGAKLRQ